MQIRMRARHRPELSDQPSRRSGWTARALVVVVNGVIASVGAVYLVTGSISATVVSGALGVILAGWLATIGR